MLLKPPTHQVTPRQTRTPLRRLRMASRAPRWKLKRRKKKTPLQQRMAVPTDPMILQASWKTAQPRTVLPRPLSLAQYPIAVRYDSPNFACSPHMSGQVLKDLSFGTLIVIYLSCCPPKLPSSLSPDPCFYFFIGYGNASRCLCRRAHFLSIKCDAACNYLFIAMSPCDSSLLCRKHIYSISAGSLTCRSR